MNFKKLTFLFAFTILFSLSFQSCGDDDDGGSGSGSVDCNSPQSVNNAISDEEEALSMALNAYSMDPSTENCDAVTVAYDDYIEALKSFQDCADEAGIGAEFEVLVATSEASLGLLGC